MPWNEPGGNGKDPWGSQKNEQGPPDLDEILKKMRDKLLGSKGGKGNPEPGDGRENFNWLTLFFVILLLIFPLLWSVIYVIQPAEQGVVLRFGRYNRTTDQGLHFQLPYPIEQVEKVNVERIRAVTHKALMLTQDENIVEIELVVQYRVKDASHYLFEVRDPDDTLHQATESALREVVGTSKMDDVLTRERARVALDTKNLVQDILNRYKAGLDVISVNMQDAQPPSAVQEAFADVIKAREDEERHKNKAEAYANEVVQKAGGLADKLRQEAQAYKAQLIARAEGETQRFVNILQEYEKAPAITRRRLYLETMESVLTNTSKVMVDIQNRNLLVLSLDELGHLARSAAQSPSQLDLDVPSSPSHPTQTPENRRDRENIRSRGGR